jgi:hypothetical protein
MTVLRELFNDWRAGRVSLAPALWAVVALAFVIMCPVMLYLSANSDDTISDPAQPIVVQVAQEFSVRMRESTLETTNWELAQPVDTTHLQLVKSEYHVFSRHLMSKRGPGPPLTRLTFRALAPGETVINVVMTGTSEASIFRVTVK